MSSNANSVPSDPRSIPASTYAPTPIYLKPINRDLVLHKAAILANIPRHDLAITTRRSPSSARQWTSCIISMIETSPGTPKEERTLITGPNKGSHNEAERGLQGDIHNKLSRTHRAAADDKGWLCQPMMIMAKRPDYDPRSTTLPST
ncbi:hypothetical protein N7G274_009696 [Stereocaulon virgatum]|uniref:Uncharacterized protein n=1 Tax=Stereocaulon virgatum TaxID=373712 RepID=A0ABR4A2M0_9LECA